MNYPTRTAAHEIDPITFEVIRHKLWSINEEGRDDDRCLRITGRARH